MPRTYQAMTAMGRRRRGFTLVEAMFAATILAIAVAGLTQAIVAGQMQTYQALNSGRATALAEALMEEILVLPYDDPGGGTTIGPDTGETLRTHFDDLDDYHGFSESAKAVYDAEGTLYADLYQVFSRSVAVTADSVDIAAFSTAHSGLTITITVTDSTNGRQWTVTRFVPEPET